MSDNDPIDNLNEKLLKYPVLDLNVVKNKIPTYSSQKLAEMVVCDRYFNCYREIAVMCMEELGRRRVDGDIFDFEMFIEKSLNDLPKLDFSVPDLTTVLRQAIGRKGIK